MAKRTGNGRRRDGIATGPDRRTTPPSDSFSSRTSLSITHPAVIFQDLMNPLLFGSISAVHHRRTGRWLWTSGLPWNASGGSKMPGERRPVRRALLEERIAPFGRLV